jgi:SAM-dependent methyltransferase
MTANRIEKKLRTGLFRANNWTVTARVRANRRQPTRREQREAVLKAVSRMLPYVLPKSIRKRIVIWLGKCRIPNRYRQSFLLLPDFARSDPAGFHQFLWSNHLGHAGSYEVAQRYGESKLEPSRRILFEEICSTLQARSVTPDRDVRSVFDAGCSLGHVLRFAETNIFPGATLLRGVDVDSFAVQRGSAHLEQLGSRAKLICSDLSQLEHAIQNESYDVSLCFGVLMYLNRSAAAEVVKVLLQHTRMLLALSTWPHPVLDNRLLTESVRASDVVTNAVDIMDGVLIHNLDAMVSEAGGRLVRRRWTGDTVIEGDKPMYYVLAEPSSSHIAEVRLDRHRR